MSKEIFEQNPHLEKVYCTSDGTPFYQENDAKNHAKTLEDKAVETVYNEKLLKVVDAEEISKEDQELAEFEAAEKAKEEQAAKEAAEKANLVKALADFDPETTKYPEALKLFIGLGLVAENVQKATIYPLLVAAKASAQEGVNTQE